MDSAKLLSSQILPFDVLFNLADELASDSKRGKDMKTLSAMSQVCRPLTNTCQRHIFEMICLLPDGIDKDILSLNTRIVSKAKSACFISFDKLEEILKSKPIIATYIRNLEYNCHPSYVYNDRIPDVLNMLTNLHALTITNFPGQRVFINWDEIPDNLVNSFGRLLSLPTLQRVNIPNARKFPMEFLSVSKNLRSLYVSDLGLKCSGSSAGGCSTLNLNHLQDLTFDIEREPKAIYDVQFMSLLGPLPSLESLNLTLIFQTLYPSQPNSHIVSSALMDKSHNAASKLRRFTVHSRLMMSPFGYAYAGNFLFEIMRDVPRWDCLERLEFSLFDSPDTDHLLELRKIDEYVCNENVFPALRIVIIHVETYARDKERNKMWKELPQAYLTNLSASRKIDLKYTTWAIYNHD